MIRGDHRRGVAGAAKGHQPRGDVLRFEAVDELDDRLDLSILPPPRGVLNPAPEELVEFTARLLEQEAELVARHRFFFAEVENAEPVIPDLLRRVAHAPDGRRPHGR
jgi:hypothetical protein